MKIFLSILERETGTSLVTGHVLGQIFEGLEKGWVTPLFRIILCQLFRTSTSDKVATIGSVSNYWPSYYFMHICNFSTFALLMRAQNRGLETDMWR